MLSIENVSIIVPVYAWKIEQIEMLDRCLESLAGQSGESIIWSDGSADGLANEFRALEAKFRWATFVFAGHNGKSVSRNNAVEMATRELIYPFDADDVLMPGAVQTLLDEWEGIPLYSDLIKVHDGTVEEAYQLPDFSCEAIQQKCIASVNVLHTKAQWDFVGGWNPETNLLEDWEYNFRLFWEFGARKVHRPLVKYFIHPDQHTSRSTARYKQTALTWVKQRINEYARRNPMAGCCGKRRTTSKTVTPQVNTAPRQPLAASRAVRTVDLSVEADLSTMGDPGPGRVWAKYFGGRGMGPHNRRGGSTRTTYQRVQYGGVYAVKEADAVHVDQFRSGRTGSEFVRMQNHVVTQPKPAAPPPPPPRPSQPPPEIVERPQIERTPVRVDRQPLTDEALASYVQSMESMTLKELKELLDSVEFGPDEINQLLQAERAGKDRIGAAKMLEKYLTNV